MTTSAANAAVQAHLTGRRQGAYFHMSKRPIGKKRISPQAIAGSRCHHGFTDMLLRREAYAEGSHV
jgi:hypothetical protein